MRKVDFFSSILPNVGLTGLPPDQRWEGTAVLGPILLEENILQEELTELLPEPASLLQTHEVTGAGKKAPVLFTLTTM